MSHTVHKIKHLTINTKIIEHLELNQKMCLSKLKEYKHFLEKKKS